MKKMNRREFLKYFGKSAAALSMANMLGPSLSLVQAAQGTGSKKFVVYVYLSGGYDGEALFPQLSGDSATYLRDTARPLIRTPEDQILKPYGSTATLGFHNSFSRLLNAASGNLNVVTGTGIMGRDPGRSHETCSKLLSLGNLDRPTYTPKGALAEIADEKNWNAYQLFGVGNFGAKMDFRTDEVAPLIVSDFASFKHSSRNFGVTTCGGRCTIDIAGDSKNVMDTVSEINGSYNITKAFEQQYEQTLDSLDETVDIISGQIAAIEPTGFYSKIEGSNASLSPFQTSCRNAEKLIRYLDANSDKDTFVLYLTLGGLDTHSNQISTLNNVVADISGGLAGLTQGLKGVSTDLWRRTTFIVTSEFGRTIRQNGTLNGGTDHGYASKTLVGGGSVRNGIIGAEWSLENVQTKNFFLPQTSMFHPIVKILEWAGATGLTTPRGDRDPIFKDGSYNLNAPLQLFI